MLIFVVMKDEKQDKDVNRGCFYPLLRLREMVVGYDLGLYQEGPFILYFESSQAQSGLVRGVLLDSLVWQGDSQLPAHHRGECRSCYVVEPLPGVEGKWRIRRYAECPDNPRISD